MREKFFFFKKREMAAIKRDAEKKKETQSKAKAEVDTP